MSRGTGSTLLRTLLIACLVLAAGCSSDPAKPGTIATATPTPTVTSASPTPTETPVATQIETAVRAYYSELATAIETGDTVRLKTTMRPSCPCYGSARSIDELAAKNQRAPDTQIKVIEVKVHDVIARSAGAEVSYDVSAHDLVKPGGAVVSHIPQRQDHVDLSLVLAEDSWVVANVFNMGGR
jgi:hypothetical protein